MEHQRKIPKLTVVLLLTVANIPAPSFGQNLYAFDVSPANGDRPLDYGWLQPSNTTTSIYQESTTYVPSSTSARSKETLDSSETSALDQHTKPSYRREEYAEDDNEDDNSEEPPDHAIPYSKHEEARDVPTRPKYVAPGLWAKPPPDKDIPLEFVPSKLHAQVRGTHTVKRLPQREAIESAESDDERRNAHRLREIVTNSKVNTVYTEEGYEDSGYDHAGHARDADFHEGYARKLRDRKDDKRDSSSGKRKRERNGDLLPDEFKEYEEDYRDHPEKSENQEEVSDDGYNLIGYGKDTWEGSGIDPRSVAEDGIQKLEADVEKNAVESERSSKDYRDAQESKIRNDVDVDDSGSGESSEENDSRNEENKLSAKKKTSELQNEKVDARDEEIRKSSKLERQKQPRRQSHETTVATSEDETSSLIDIYVPASPHGFVTNPTNLQTYSSDQTTPRYVAPIAATASFPLIDEPTTVSYSQLFWDYFKTKEDTPGIDSTALVPNKTATASPERAEERTPIALATIDGHGPYLLVTADETTTLSSSFLGSPTFQTSLLDSVEFGTGFSQGHRLAGQSDDIGYVDNINNVITAQSTLATFADAQPLALRPAQSSKLEETEQPSSASPLDGIAFGGTPAVMTLNFTKEAYSRMADYQANPFLGPILDNSNIAITRDKFKYKVLVRPRPKNPVKPVAHKSATERTSSSSSSREKDENKKIRDELNAKYTKVLDYLRSKQKIQPLSDNKRIVLPDFKPTRPPALQRGIAYPVFSTSRSPIANHSSVSVESESPREANWRSAFLRDQRRPQPAIEWPYRVEPFAVAQPMRLTYRRNSLPATKLLPPSPIAIADYRSDSQNHDYASYADDRRQKQRQRDNASRYLSLVPEASWRTRSRRKRSDGGEPREDSSDVKAEANNSATENGESREQRDKPIFDGAAVETNGKPFDRKMIDAPINVSDTTRARDGESVTFAALMSKNSSATADGESGNIEARRDDTRGTATHDPESTERAPTLLQSGTRRKMNDTSPGDELTKKKRNVSRSKARRAGGNATGGTNQRDHEKLLDESSRISGDVVDKEIAVRFNGKDTNETTTKEKDASEIEVKVPKSEIVEEFAEDDPAESFAKAVIDSKKYPFYNNKDVPSASALKYVVDPRTVPRKTSRGMEFYDSRNAYRRCDEIEPNLDKVLPEKEEPDPKRDPVQEDLPRLRGLGGKLDCFKAKYFDEDPFDNPLFAEKLIEEATQPSELDPVKFASKVMLLPEENDEYVVQRLSKKPERSGRRWRNRNPQYDAHESIRVKYRHDPLTGRGRNAYLHTVRGLGPPMETPKRPFRRVKIRRTRPRSTTPSTPKSYQTASYQNQVYEDVMGNIRNMANAYQVYEMTELPPATQILATASSETALKVSNITSNASKGKTTALPKVSSNKESPEIKGLLPPPKYTVPRQAMYRNHRPLDKSRTTLMRPPDLPRIIAHHHTIKINKRSAMKDIANDSSVSTNEDDKSILEKSTNVRNDTVGESVEKATKTTNSTVETLDMETGESRQIRIRDQQFEADKKKRRSGSQRDESPQRIVYTIRDRIRYSKPKWDTVGFGKFSTTARSATDEDSRRKEPRYNYFKRKKLIPDQRSSSTISPQYNSTDGASRIESAASSTEARESGTTEVYLPAESVLRQSTYDRKNAPEKTDRSDESAEEEETEGTTNTYHVHEDVKENVDEDVDEDVSATTTKRTSILNSKEVLDLQKYLETDPPDYAETFPEETTTSSSKYRANSKSEEQDEKQDEENEEKSANPWKDDSSENVQEQIETPVKTEFSAQEDSSEEFPSKEEESTKDDRTFYTTRPSWIEKGEDSKKATVYRSFPFSRYKSIREKGSDEDDAEGDSDEEKEEDYVFPWHADKEDKDGTRKRLRDFDVFEYPWEKRERLARERRRKQRLANRFKSPIFLDEDDDEEAESRRQEKPVYPWERYNVPSKDRVNARRDVSTPSNIGDDNAESISEQLPLIKFSSRYSSGGGTTVKPSSAREISKSIRKFLEEDFNDESREEASKESSSSARKSNRGISRGTLVPEDVTQPPRRRNGRRRVPRVDKKASSGSLFNSKESKSTEFGDRETKPIIEHLKLSKNNRDGSDIRIETANSQSGTSSPTTQRKKRRRKILKNNSTVSDNATAESITEPTRRRRRKPQASTTSATSSADIDFETNKSIFAPARNGYSKADDVVKTTGSSFFESRLIGEATNADNAEIETSTPKTRTVEHRSRVSKEKIVTKTTYPKETEDFDFAKKNATSARKSLAKKLNVKPNHRNNRQNINDRYHQGVEDKLTKRKDEKRNYDIELINEDEARKLAISEELKAKGENNPLKSLGMRKEEIKKINNFSSLDGLINNEGDDNDFGSTMTSEIYAASNLLRNTPPSRRNEKPGAKKRTGNESSKTRVDGRERISGEKENKGEEDKDAEERRRSLLQTKFIKDPDRRLYYYIEHK